MTQDWMDDMLVIVPTRGRPQNMVELIHTWIDTAQFAHLLFVVDDDDPELKNYLAAFEDNRSPGIFLEVDSRARLGGTLNKWSVKKSEEYDVIGFMGDDHRPRTLSWDNKVMDAFETLPNGSGFVYGNDLNWGEGLPTSVFISSDIIETLGFMVPKGMIHLYFDNFWLDFGRALGRIVYLPDVIIEHMHPSVGKAINDAGYQEVNAPTMFDHDREVYEKYQREQMQEDLRKCE